MERKELGKQAEAYTRLLNNEDFVNRHFKDIKDFAEFCKEKILGDAFHSFAGCKDFAEYRYWLGRYHNSIEILNLPEMVIDKLRKEIETGEENNG